MPLVPIRTIGIMGLMARLKRFLFMPKYRGASLSRITLGRILESLILNVSIAYLE